MHGTTSELSDATTVLCFDKYVVTSKPMCYVTKARPQKPYDVQQSMLYNDKTHGLQYRSIWFTTAHTDYNSGIGFTVRTETKKAGIVKQEQAQQSTNAAVNIREAIGQSSLKV